MRKRLLWLILIVLLLCVSTVSGAETDQTMSLDDLIRWK